jgi:hypothetical protein
MRVLIREYNKSENSILLFGYIKIGIIENKTYMIDLINYADMFL